MYKDITYPGTIWKCKEGREGGKKGGIKRERKTERDRGKTLHIVR